MGDWKAILKNKRKSGKLMRYMTYAQANRHNVHDLMTMEQFAERVHRKLRTLSSENDFSSLRLIEKEIFDEINALDSSDPKMPFDIPFSYEEYMEKYGKEVEEERDRENELVQRLQEQTQRQRKEREKALREKRGSEYWAKYGPKPLSPPKEEE
jgi:queuine/archaeosine tRNA-ribosyltransferase